MNTITSTTFPEATGISASCIMDALREIDARGISMHSFLFCKDNCLVAEGYYAPVKKNDLHRMFSVTKSFVSIAIGFLQEEGRLSLDDSIVKFSQNTFRTLPRHIHGFLPPQSATCSPCVPATLQLLTINSVQKQTGLKAFLP